MFGKHEDFTGVGTNSIRNALALDGSDYSPDYLFDEGSDQYIINRAALIHSSDTTYGLEVELECADGTGSGAIDMWLHEQHRDSITRRLLQTKPDGSLRNGRELVSVAGRFCPNYRDIRLLMNGIQPLLDGDAVERSWRAALQLHIGMGSFTNLHLASLMMTYIVYEPLIFQRVGRGRHQSNFCVPWSQQSDVIYNILRGDWDCLLMGADSFPKYSALNLRTLTSIGTVEFRHAETPAGFVGAALEATHILSGWRWLFLKSCHIIDEAASLVGFGSSRGSPADEWRWDEAEARWITGDDVDEASVLTQAGFLEFCYNKAKASISMELADTPPAPEYEPLYRGSDRLVARILS